MPAPTSGLPDLLAMGRGICGITHYQPVLYVWSSAAEMEDGLSAFLEGFDDATYRRLVR